MVRADPAHMAILPASELDPHKWDSCVFGAGNGRLFAAYDYLSHMAPCWSGLVLDDYQAVLPLIHKRKFGISYLATLPFINQLGLIGTLNAEFDIAPVLRTVHQFAKYGDICFNHTNGRFMETYGRPRPNFELALNRDHAHIFNHYHKGLRKHLRQIKDGRQLFFAPANPSEVIDHYQAFLKQKAGIQLSDDFNRLRALVDTDFGKRHFFPYKVTGDNGHVLLYGLYGKDRYRIYKFMTTTTPEGRKANAAAFALDYLIARYALSDRTLDFMGSALEGVRSFIESFGAVNQPYYLYHYNHLPWPLRLWKR